MYKTDFIFFGIMILILFIFCVLPVMIFVPIYRNSATQVIITVKEKESVKHGESSSKYLIWTEEGEVFEDTDSWSFMKFNSSDIYGEIEVGKTYCVVVAGWRVPFLSWYRNIIKFCSDMH